MEYNADLFNSLKNPLIPLAKMSHAARDCVNRVQVGKVGNVPIPTPLAYESFGGWKRSVFGDLNQHGPDSLRFYTKTKTVTARWPSGVKAGAEFSMPTREQSSNTNGRKR